jgi:ferredoxin
LAVEHLRVESKAAIDAITLPPRASPFGSLDIDTQKCTMCLSCVGACPSAALADNPSKLQLRFIEKNCVQCGLCASTCPEQAISLHPRLLLADEGRTRKESRVLNESEPYRCIRCSKPFGTLQAIELMVTKLGMHAMFQGAAADRLRMCGDCRVIDIHSSSSEVRITDV